MKSFNVNFLFQNQNKESFDVHLILEMSVRHSKVQVQVLTLYKACLRAAQGKSGFESAVKCEFRKNAKINKSDILIIEHLMRNGGRKLKMMNDPNVSGMGHFVGEKPAGK